MRKFTVKDIIYDNSPCFGCGNKIMVQVGVTSPDFPDPEISLTTKVNKNDISMNLQITYNSSLNLVIDYKTNKYLTNDTTALTKYLEGHKLYLRCMCDKCGTFLTTRQLEFSLLGFVRPVEISSELIIILEGKNMYEIESHYLEGKNGTTTIFVDHLGKGGAVSSTTRFDLPLMPRYRFRNKENLLNKIRTYLIFS